MCELNIGYHRARAKADSTAYQEAPATENLPRSLLSSTTPCPTTLPLLITTLSDAVDADGIAGCSEIWCEEAGSQTRFRKFDGRLRPADGIADHRWRRGFVGVQHLVETLQTAGGHCGDVCNLPTPALGTDRLHGQHKAVL
eukprot:2705575-Rhodomonas_salina.1